MKLETPIKTARLLLRTLTRDDAGDCYLSWMQDSEVTRYLESRFQHFDLDRLAQFIESLNASPDELFLGLFLADDGRHIGNIRLGPISRIHRHAVIGLLIGERDCWGKGYATEAIAAIAAQAFNEFGLEKVFAGCYASNEGSRRAFLKAGFAEEARLPDHWRCEGERVDHVQLGLSRSVWTLGEGNGT